MCTTVDHPTEIEFKNPYVKQLIRYYHAIVHDVIGVSVVVDSEYKNVFVYDDEPRKAIKTNYGEYCVF